VPPPCRDDNGECCCPAPRLGNFLLRRGTLPRGNGRSGWGVFRFFFLVVLPFFPATTAAAVALGLMAGVVPACSSTTVAVHR
jgi:hypothetical protein